LSHFININLRNDEICSAFCEIIVHLIVIMEVWCVIVSACKLHLMMHLQLPLSFLEYILHWQELSQGTIPNDLKMIKLPFILFELLITYADSGCLS
jgi:hypothetical protein